MENYGCAITVDVQSAVDLIVIEGAVDICNVQLMREALKNNAVHIDKPLIVDLTKVTLFDATALGVLVINLANINQFGYKFAVVRPSEKPANRIFEITRTDLVLNIVDTIDEALERVQ